MGLTFQSTQSDALTDVNVIEKKEGQYVIALAGNPNTGKSTVFNALTGLHQHTGNWPGKTVVSARGEYTYAGKEFILVDLPGTYSLFAASVEEEVARDFLCFGNSDAVIVVADATCLERNLNLVYQVMELTNRVILCINLVDEARKKKIEIDAAGLEQELGIPIVLCAARSRKGIDELMETVNKVVTDELVPSPNYVRYPGELESRIQLLQAFMEEKAKDFSSRWLVLRIIDGDERLLHSIARNSQMDIQGSDQVVTQETLAIEDRSSVRDIITQAIYQKAEELKERFIIERSEPNRRDRKIDNIITSRIVGIPLMLSLLALVLWITISGANVPSAMLAEFLFGIGDQLSGLFMRINAPDWLHGILVQGLYKTLAWVVSVMLPPMAIFFPLFTILEDLGYLPRVAFNLDHMFKKACAHGKQCLTMCMGLGCNAAGITACRIIDSPRERLIAILTNNFVPCNGRFPTLIAISSIFLLSYTGGSLGILPALMVTGLIVIGITVTLCLSYLLSKTILRGVPSTFTLELPPYRVPKIGRVLYTSVIDRTIFVLWRAIIVAAPAGAITWLFSNLYIGDLSILGHVAGFLDPAAKLIGLDGFILIAFLLALPANEIMLPILLMAYLATGTMVDFDSLASLRTILLEHGWTPLTALNVMLFSLLHWPCATTLLTIKKETGSLKWTVLSALIPTAVAVVLCLITTLLYKLVVVMNI